MNELRDLEVTPTPIIEEIGENIVIKIFTDSIVISQYVGIGDQEEVILSRGNVEKLLFLINRDFRQSLKDP